MKVAIDISALNSGHKFRGVGFYLQELLKSLKEESRKDKKLKIFALDVRGKNLSKYDIVHYPFFEPFFITLPRKKETRIVVTIHDLIPLIYPEHYPPGVRGKIKFFIQKSRLKNVDFVITDSECSKKDIVRFLSIPKEKISVVYLSARKIFRQIKDYKKLREVRQKYNLPTKFILYVGDLNYNKNVLSLIEASKIANLPLVICGKQALEIEEKIRSGSENLGIRDLFRNFFGISHPELKHFERLIKEFRENSKILRLGFVTDRDLVKIYNLASVYCQPSFYEGFGLPVLEAFSCGCPVVISKTNALVEIGGGSSLISDGTPKDLAQKILEVIQNPLLRAELIRKSFQEVKKYSWRKVAQKTIKVYKTVFKT